MKHLNHLMVILALVTGMHPVAAQQNEFSNGCGYKVFGETSILELTDSSSVELVDGSESQKEMAGFAAIAGALVTPVVNSFSTGLKNYAEKRANSFSSTHDARDAWNEMVNKAAEDVHHKIPSAKYHRTVVGVNGEQTLAMSFFLLPIEIEVGKRYAYRLESVNVASTAARLTKKAKHITLEVKPTIDYFVDGERKSIELGTMRLQLVEPGANEGNERTIDSDQFYFDPKYRFAGMTVVVTEVNPRKVKADKRKDRLAEYNTDASKEAIVNVINLLLPKEENGSGDTAPEVIPEGEDANN
jgi:hypothetical protein